MRTSLLVLLLFVPALCAQAQPKADPDAEKLAWDKERLKGFEKECQALLDDLDATLGALAKETLERKKQRLAFAGHKDLGAANLKENPDTGFHPLLGAMRLIAYRTAQGTAIAEAYKKAAADPNAVIDAATGELDGRTKFKVNIPTMPKSLEGEFKTRELEITAEDALSLIEQLDSELDLLEYEKVATEFMIAALDRLISSMEAVAKAGTDSVKQLRLECKQVGASINIKIDKLDWKQFNETLEGKSDKNELGKQVRKLLDGIEKTAQALDVKTEPDTAQLPKLTKPAKSRFLDRKRDAK